MHSPQTDRRSVLSLSPTPWAIKLTTCCLTFLSGRQVYPLAMIDFWSDSVQRLACRS